MKATHSGKLQFGDVEIPCYVLGDGRRVLSGRGMCAALAPQLCSGPKLARFLGQKRRKSVVSGNLIAILNLPTRFRTKTRGEGPWFRGLCMPKHCPGNSTGEEVPQAIASAMPQALQPGRVGAVTPRWDRVRNVIRHHRATMVLADCGFATNPRDNAYLTSR